MSVQTRTHFHTLPRSLSCALSHTHACRYVDNHIKEYGRRGVCARRFGPLQGLPEMPPASRDPPPSLGRAPAPADGHAYVSGRGADSADASLRSASAREDRSAQASLGAPRSGQQAVATGSRQGGMASFGTPPGGVRLGSRYPLRCDRWPEMLDVDRWVDRRLAHRLRGIGLGARNPARCAAVHALVQTPSTPFSLGSDVLCAG